MWADILTHQELPVDSLEGIAAIRRCAETQRRLVEDLLDMARSHTGKLRMEMERHDLVAVVAGALDAARPLLAEKNIKLASLLDSSREAIVWADRTRLQQVVLNLIGNAIKFTPESGIINVSMEQTTTPPMATITVRDNGRGIDAQDLPHIFDQFWQAGNTKKLAGDGMGLGLAIARDLVKLHNGRIHAESEGQGRGAAFLVELPLASVNSAGPGSTISIQPDSHAELRARHATA
jgi:signal transduction histidine kinase